jgi:hypothetical protein
VITSDLSVYRVGMSRPHDPARPDDIMLRQFADADRQLAEAYREQPPDWEVLESARRLAAETAPPW